MEKNHIFPFLWMRGEDEAILRNEIEKIYECGIRAVCVEARPHNDFCGAGWWHDMDIVIEEAKRRKMKIWILDDKHFPTGYANGLIETKYPERKKQYINCTTADIFGGSHKRTLNINRMLKPTIGYWEIGLPVNEEERKKNQLIAITAVKFGEGDIFKEETIDLLHTYDGTNATFELPEGQWRIYVVYKTRTDGGNEAYINMIDKVSAHTQIEGVYEAHYEHYADEFGKTIAGFFSDEPQFGNTNEIGFDMRLGKKKMPLPWSDELQSMMQEKYGEQYLKYLPYLFVETEEQNLGVQIRYDYMDFVSKLYQKNFSEPIGEWCREHGVEYIGHVVEDNGIHSRLGMGAGHYFRAMSGQDMAGIDVIGGQVIYGAPVQTRKGMTEADGEFFHFALGKMGASCGHLDPKKKGRTMCELFGAYGWSFGVRDMKYLLDHLLVKGVNYLVPHAFSMAEYPDIDCPPHFYARGNNPEFPYFAELMKYGNRMCNLLSGGKHVASVAVLYDGEADWSGTQHMPMQKVGRQLIENQIDFDIVSLDMLNNLQKYQGCVDGETLHINGESFKALIVPYVKYASEKLLVFLEQAGEFPVIFVDAFPEKVIGRDSNNIQNINRKACKTVALEELSAYLRKKGFYEIALDHAFKELSFYHYVKDRHIFVFQNESSCQKFAGTVRLPIGEYIYYDAMREEYKGADIEQLEEESVVSLELEPGESCVLLEKKEIVCDTIRKSFSKQRENSICIDISENWQVRKGKAKEYPQLKEEGIMQKLTAISDINPTFSGIIQYTKQIDLSDVMKKVQVYLQAEHVYEVMKVVINGEQAEVCLTPPYQVEIGQYLKTGKNEILIEVATTPARDQLNYPKPPFDFTHEAMEPTGMFGNIVLHISGTTL